MEYIPVLLIMILSIVGILYAWYRYWKKYKRRDKAVEIKDMIAGASEENYFNQFRKKEDE